MAYLKFSGDKLFNGYQFEKKDSVLVVEEDGRVEAIVPAIDAGGDVQVLEGIISPGFINCHCHLELSHMKGLIPEQTGLVDFVLHVMQQRHIDEEEILAAIAAAEDEMLNNGIVAAGDICNTTLTLSQKTKGRIYYHNFIEASGFNPATVKQRFESNVDIFNTFAKNYSIPVESNSIVPHAPYSVADELWDLIIHFPGNHLFTIHNQEDIGETEWFHSKTGSFQRLYEALKIDTGFFSARNSSSLKNYLPKFLPNQAVILVHNVHSAADDILFALETIQQADLSWCLCPNANQYITRQLPPIDLLIKHDCNIVLGTDSLASNHQLSILEEMKTIRKNYDVTDELLLRWATSNGAKALQMDNLLGGFEKAKSPGVILLTPTMDHVERIL